MRLLRRRSSCMGSSYAAWMLVPVLELGRAAVRKRSERAVCRPSHQIAGMGSWTCG